MERRSKRKVILWLVVAAAVIAAFGIVMHVIENLLDDEIADYDITSDEGIILYINETEYEVTHNIESYLLIGTDDSGNVEAEGTKDYRGPMSDFLLLYVMDKTAGTHGYLQIDRNTMVDVPYIGPDGNGEGENFEQICTASWYGNNPTVGCNNSVYCVSTLMGDLPINGFYSIHMSDIGKLNHAVGGVEITLEDDFTDADPEMKKGATLLLTDAQAETYVRGRMEVGEGTNEERLHRQLTYMDKCKEKVRTMIGEDPDFVNDLWDTLEAGAVTDISKNRISVMANQMYKGKDLGILTIDGETKVGTTLDDGLEHEEFYADEASIGDAIVKLCGVSEDHIYPDTGEDE